MIGRTNANIVTGAFLARIWKDFKELLQKQYKLEIINVHITFIVQKIVY